MKTVLRWLFVPTVVVGCVSAVASLLLCGFLTPSVFAQDAPDYQTLVGVWTWRPISTWSAQLTVKEVSDTGRVTAEWRDPTSAIPFTTQARMDGGTIKLAFGQSVKFDLEYDKKSDTLIGPATGWPPRFEGAPAWNTAYFRRSK